MPNIRCLGSLRSLSRLALGLSLFGMIGLAAPTPTGASDTGTLIIHARVCPNAHPRSFFKDCHPRKPEQRVAFSVAGRTPRAVSTRTGNIKFLYLAPGNRQVTETDGPPGDFTGRRVYCSINGGPAVEVAANLPKFSAPIQAGKTTICDVYVTILPT